MFTVTSRALILTFLSSVPVVGQLLDPDYYVLYHPTGSNPTRLIDSSTNELNSWPATLNSVSASTAYLREDGLLLRSGQEGNLPRGFLAGSFSTVQLVDWNGNVVWEFNHQEAGEFTLHHDIKTVPNGNILVTVWELFSAAEMAELGGLEQVWSEKIMELAPNLEDGSTEIVWEWSLSDHLVQDADRNAPNFGEVASQPGLVDIRFNLGITSGDYFHISGISYNVERDEIILCPNNIDELWIIDHSTTTAEAATSSGGRRGRGGNLIYRWGNSAVYRHGGGATETQILERAHDPRWLLCPENGDWRMTVHNNDQARTSLPTDSQILEIDLPLDESGNYLLAENTSYGPSNPTVLFEDISRFSTPFMGSGQKLSNDHIFITRALDPGFLEVDPAGTTIWEFTAPEGGFIFKASKYPISFPGFGPELAITYEIWANAHFGEAPGLARGPQDDPDTDGRPNLMEYYLGSNPQAHDPESILEAELGEENGESLLRVSYRPRANVPDVNGRIEFSRSLDPWIDESDSLNTSSRSEQCGGGQENIQWEARLENGLPRGFVRLVIE